MIKVWLPVSVLVHPKGVGWGSGQVLPHHTGKNFFTDQVGRTRLSKISLNAVAVEVLLIEKHEKHHHVCRSDPLANHLQMFPKCTSASSYFFSSVTQFPAPVSPFLFLSNYTLSSLGARHCLAFIKATEEPLKTILCVCAGKAPEIICLPSAL